jgi:hypothetical protein
MVPAHPPRVFTERISELRSEYLVPLARWNIPPAAVGDLTIIDFAQMTAAIDAASEQDGG